MKAQDLLKKHPIYEATQQQMLNYQLAYLGGYQFKTSVREKRPSEDQRLYHDLIENTVAQPIARYVVDTINNILFEPGVHRDVKFVTPEGKQLELLNNNWSDLFVLDADLQNRSLDSFMEHVSDLTSIYGHCWVFVDMPEETEGNLGRPYVVAVNPLDIWDWDFEYYGGRAIPKYVKVKESETDTDFYIKVYQLGDATTPSSWTSYIVPKKATETAIIDKQGFFPPGMAIPGFIAYGRRDPRRQDIGISDIDSVTDAMREFYKLECEAYSSIQFAKTLIRADKGIPIPVHAGAIVRATQGQVEAISVDTGDVEKTIVKQAQILEHIEGLTGLSGVRSKKSQIASGIAIVQERKQLHQVAKSKARLMEIAEETIFTFAARFMNMRWAGEVTYDTNYDQHDQQYKLALMQQAKELLPDNEIIKAVITKELVKMIVPDEPVVLEMLTETSEGLTKELFVEQDEQHETRDIGSQIPTRLADNIDGNETTKENQ